MKPTLAILTALLLAPLAALHATADDVSLRRRVRHLRRQAVTRPFGCDAPLRPECHVEDTAGQYGGGTLPGSPRRYLCLLSRLP